VNAYPGFGPFLARILALRNEEVSRFCAQSGVFEPEFRAVLAGVAPSAEFFELVAPQLGIHAADLLVMAKRPVPRGMAPLDSRAASRVGEVVIDTAGLSLEHLRELRDYINSMPRSPVSGQPWELAEAVEYGLDFGGMLARMLLNRNLDRWSTVHALAWLTGPGLSRSTIWLMGKGEWEVPSRMVPYFAILLGIPAEYLAALGGMELHEDFPLPSPEQSEIAEIVWEVRSLTLDQVREVARMAASMR
jgi:hypothetical protein